MREFGGYIEFETFSGKEYHNSAIALNSGRSCAEYILRAQEIRKLYLPYFLCDSVREICDKLGLSVNYYHLNSEWSPEINFSMQEGEYLYIVNYYGQVTNTMINSFAERFGNIIVDNVQAFFQEPAQGIDTIYSCRKFFGVADGAYLYTNSQYNEPIEIDYSYDRMHFLLGRYEKEASLFYNEYVQNNEFFSGEPIRYMSELTHNLLRGINYEKVKEQRTRNFEYLHRHFKEVNRLNLLIPSGAYMYPLFVSNGREARKLLQQKKIYIPILWPDVLSVCMETDLEYNLAENILPIPVDQRYTEEDMEYIAKEMDNVLLEI